MKDEFKIKREADAKVKEWRVRDLNFVRLHLEALRTHNANKETKIEDLAIQKREDEKEVRNRRQAKSYSATYASNP